MTTYHNIYKNRPKPWWLKQGPWKIGKLAIYTNADTTKLPLIGSHYFKANKGPLWKEWGAVYFDIRIYKWWIKFRYAVGNKTAVIPRWMEQ